MESERRDYLKNTPTEQRQADIKQYIESLFHMGKYEDPSRGIYADPKGYEAYMAKAGIEPYPLKFGGSGIVTKPTMFMMGEAGPEAYNIQPLSKGKASSGIGNNLRIENINISFPNADPDRMDKGRFKHLIVTSLRELANDGTINKAVL
jgi:hypothetical protein